MASINKSAIVTTDELQQSLTSSRLEEAYERALRQAQTILSDEATRVLRVRIMLLEHENDTLQEQLDEADYRLEDLENAEADARDNLIDAENHLQRAQHDLRLKAREVETLKAELISLNTVSVDSTKLLTEKLALAREVATLRPEIEHLRSQVTSHQSVLSEKLALQRQLSSVQVELETERRALKRTQAKDSRDSEGDAKLVAQLEELKKELAKEKRDNQKAARDAQKQAAEWEGQKTILESKLDAFRNKLRSTKDQLKEARAELHESQASFKPSQPAYIDERPLAKPGKRTVARFDPDATIGTPGAAQAAKRARQSSAVPGDKSTFSITPFLNRTSNIGLSSPPAEETNAGKAQESTTQAGAPSSEAPEVPHSPTANKSKPAQKPPAVGDKAVPLRETTNSTANTKIPPSASRKSSKPSTSSLEKVTEEDDAEAETTKATLPARTSTATVFSAVSIPDEEGSENQIQPKQPPGAAKKKRKLLGGDRSTLFDEDEAEAPAAKTARRVFLGGGLRGGGGAGISLARGGVRKVGLKEFSPLKRDRKAAV